MGRKRMLQSAFLVVAMTPVAHGQSFNIDLGLGVGPSDTYAGAAGVGGHWISVPGTEGETVSNLVDVHGNVTSARFNQFGGTETLQFSDPSVSGDDATLLNDALITHTTIENCMFFSGMEAGRYAVLIYAWMPGEPDVLAVTNVDQEIGNPHLMVGGAWAGNHAAGISYSLHIADVAALGAQAGRLGLHSGVPDGGDFTIGAALNGVQIVKLGDPDFDGNGSVDVVDADLLVAQIASGNGTILYDLTGDGAVDHLDLDQWLTDAGSMNLPSGQPYLPADANLDGIVDGQDFIAWNSNRFMSTAAWSAGDFTADGIVDGQDFIVWNDFRFQSADGANVPEANALWMLCWIPLLTGKNMMRRSGTT